MPPSQAFHFCRAMRLLCEDAVSRMADFSHIRMDEVAVAFAQARRHVSHGLQAKLTPMRFEGGSLVMQRGGQKWTVQRLFERDRELLYILTFYLPRFQNQPFREKLITVFHELYHIGPFFDGDIRRMEGRYHVHSSSQQEYDRQMGEYADRYLKMCPDESLYDFLRYDFHQLSRRHGAVVGVQVPIPKLIRITAKKSA